MTSPATIIRRPGVGLFAALGFPFLLLSLLSSSPQSASGVYGGNLPPLPKPKVVPRLDLTGYTARDAFDELDYRWGDGLVLFVRELDPTQVGHYPVLGIAPYHPTASHFDPVLLSPGQKMLIYAGPPPSPHSSNTPVPVPGPPWLDRTVGEVYAELTLAWGAGLVDVVEIVPPQYVLESDPHYGISPNGYAGTATDPILLTAGQMMHVYVGGAHQASEPGE